MSHFATPKTGNDHVVASADWLRKVVTKALADRMAGDETGEWVRRIGEPPCDCTLDLALIILVAGTPATAEAIDAFTALCDLVRDALTAVYTT